MKSIVCTYPDFRTLPKGLRQMLVVSETHFFGEAQTAAPESNARERGTKQWWRPGQPAAAAFLAAGPAALRA